MYNNILYKEIYESQILNQQINYYILETKYDNQKTILNESIGDKVKGAKDWIKERVGKLIDIVQKVLKKIRYFFFEYLPGKFKALKDKITKKNKEDNGNKKEDYKNKKLKTIDIEHMLSNAVSIHLRIRDVHEIIPDPEKTNECSKKYREEKYDEIINLTFDELYKKEIDFLKNVDNENNLIEITYDEILDFYTDWLYDGKRFTQKTKETPESLAEILNQDLQYIQRYPEKMDEEDVKLYAKCTQKVISILNSIIELYNKYATRIFQYFNKYLDIDTADKIHADNIKKHNDEYETEKKKSELMDQQSKDNAPYHVLGALMDRNFTLADTCMKLMKQKGLDDSSYKVDDHCMAISDNKDDYKSRKYLQQQQWAFQKNPCEKRYQHLKMLYKITKYNNTF